MNVLYQEMGELYPPRTAFNAKSGDMTISFSVDFNSAGEKLTKKLVTQYHSEHHFCEIDMNTMSPLDAARKVYKYALTHNIQNLNIAGNGIYGFVSASNKWSQVEVNQYVYLVLRQVLEGLKLKEYPFNINKVFTGGQTGADWAGAVAAVALGIDCLVTFPNGYIQRMEDKKTIRNTQESLKIKMEKELNKIVLDMDINSAKQHFEEINRKNNIKNKFTI